MVVGNSIQPDSKRRRRLQFAQRAKHVQPYILQNISCLVRILDQTVHIVRQSLLVGRDKLVKRRAISRLGSQHHETLAKSLGVFVQIAQCR